MQASVTALGVLALALTLAAWRVPAPVDLGPRLGLAAAGFAALLYVLQQQGFVFRWREHSTKISLDELGVFLALLLLSPALVVLCVASASLLNQAVHRRDLAKGAFNVAQYTIAAFAAAAIATCLRSLGVPMLLAAAPAPLVFAAVTALLVSALFARLDRAPTLRVFTQRFGSFVLVAGALGLSLGLIVVALFSLHPAAVLAVIPVFVHLRRFGRLSEWADDELSTHRLVAGLSVEVAGRADMDHVAQRILATCHELFDCGEARLELEDAQGPEHAPRTWAARFGESAVSGSASAEIPGADGTRLGSLVVAPRPGRSGYGEREQLLLRAVASAATAAATNAQALATQQALVKRLQNMNRELEEFTLWTTHDMREPLRSIATVADLLHDDIDHTTPDEAREMARRICEGAERLKERIKALHAFSVIVQRDDAFHEVDMQRVVENVVQSLEAKIQEKHALVRLAAEPFPTLRAQPHRLDQVVGNLVENALKYGTSASPVVEIGHEEAGQEWRLYVRDNGPGIPAGYHERIFQLFHRGPASTEGGSGAGLAIVKRIAEQHGGRAWVESIPAKGACFYVGLPKETLLTAGPMAAATCSSAAPADGRSTPPRSSTARRRMASP